VELFCLLIKDGGVLEKISEFLFSMEELVENLFLGEIML
jgi:hypothetical protein